MTISIFPDLIFERSKVSLISVSSSLLAPWMLRAFSATSSEMSSRRMISLSPMIVLMGVRISWLMLEKKWFSARLSSSISFFCCWVILFSSSYIRFRNMSSTLVSSPTMIMEKAESKKELVLGFCTANSGW